MMIRPKTKRRVSILVACLLVLGGIITVFVVIRHRSINAVIAQARADGIAAFKAGNYPVALTKLSFYNTRNKQDPETLMDFGIAETKVPKADGGEDFDQAIRAFRTYQSMRPNDVEAQHLLMKTYERLPGYAGPELSTANDILKKDPNDLPALHAIVLIDSQERKFPEALDAAVKYTAIDPTDLDMQGQVLALMKNLESTPPQMHARADAVAKILSPDPRALVVQAFAYQTSIQPTDTSDKVQRAAESERQLLLEAAKQDAPDAQFVKHVVKLLDNLGQFSVSQEMLDRAAARLNDPDLTRQLIARLWQNQKNAEVVTKLQSIDPAKEDANLVAYKALALRDLGKKAESDALIDQLNKRSGEPLAVGLSLAMKTYFDPGNPDPKTRISQYTQALQHAPQSSIIEFMLGETYSRMGENDLALQEWRTISAQVPSWAMPHLRIATLLVDQGRGSDEESFRNSQQAIIADTTDTGEVTGTAVITDALIKFARWQASNDPAAARSLLEEMQTIQAKIPGEPNTLPLYVALLAATDQHDKAVDVIKTAISQTNQNGQTLLLELARRSKAYKLGMEEQLYKAVEQQYGMTPALAAMQAADMLAAGHAADGLKYLQDKKPADGHDDALWQRAICLYMEKSHDPQVVAAWKALGDRYPNDLVTQSSILNDFSSAWQDRAFIDVTIDRLKNLTGDSAMAWKLSRARWLIDSPDIQRDCTAAVALLNEVEKNSPGEFTPHLLLAEAYDALNNNAQAVPQWQQAAEIMPNDPLVLYRLLAAQHTAGKIDEVRATFERLAAIPHLPPDVATRAAFYVAQDGQPDRAEKLLLAYPVSPNQVLHDSTLAKIYRLEGRVNDAVSIYFKLATEPNLDLATIREAADFFGSQHDPVAAHKFLDLLPTMQLPPGAAQTVLADFDENYGDPSAAAGEYSAAVKQAGDQPAAAVQQIGFLIRKSQWDAARSEIDSALARWPGNADLTNLKSLEATLAGMKDTSQLTMLIKEITRNPADQAAGDTLRVMAAAPSVQPVATLKSLQDLLARYPAFEPLSGLTIQQLVNMNRKGEAVAQASTAMSQFPNSPDAARNAAEMFAIVGRWNDALDAAEKWRARGAVRPQEADLMIATADLYLDLPRDGVERLTPYITAAAANPDANVNLIVCYVELLCRANRDDDAAALLTPLAQKSADWRAHWLMSAGLAHKDGPATIAWIDRVRPMLAADSLAEQQHLADAYFDCALHKDYSQGFALARDVLKPFVGSPQMTAAGMMTYASDADNANDPTTAEAAYRQVLKMEADQPVAMNNLASLLGKKGDPDSLKEAEALARKACAAHPSDPETSSFYDTLARILEKENRTDDALAAFKAGNNLNPNDPNVLIGLANLSARTNSIDAATRYLAQIDSLLPPGFKMPADVQAELDGARAMVKKANNSSSLTGTN